MIANKKNIFRNLKY